MKASPALTPLGCGPYRGEGPDFPDDLLTRLETLDLGAEDIYLAWELVSLTGQRFDPSLQRALILLVLAVRLSSAEGSTRLPLGPGGYLDRLLEEFQANAGEHRDMETLLAGVRKAEWENIDPSLSLLFGSPGEYRPLIIDHDFLYIQKNHVLEARVGKNLAERLNDPSAGGPGAPVEDKLEPALEKALQDVYHTPPAGPFGNIVPDSEQLKAIRATLRGKIAVISGRPGSGKTSIVAGLLRVIARTGQPPLESVALAAPTGKAADRLRRSIADHLSAISEAAPADRSLIDACPLSSTLHRLLGYMALEDRFRHNEHNPLSEQLVIVDESSMIDLPLMDQLLRALNPASRLILLGDADQLPPVGAGAVLRDLCLSKQAKEQGRAVVLEHSYRARKEDPDGSRILEAAKAINSGNSPLATGTASPFELLERATALKFKGVEHLVTANPEEVEAFYTRWEEQFKAQLPDLQDRLNREYLSGPEGFDEETSRDLQILLDHYERFRILTVTRVSAGGTGSDAVNRRFHCRRLEEAGSAGAGLENTDYLVGEPVLVTKNDYGLRLFNGDAGLLLMIKTRSRSGSRYSEMMVVFPCGGSFLAYPLEALRGKLELSWATTVHKAQGSEYDHIAIMLPALPVRPLTRELLYTAVTRARKSVTFIGSTEILASGIKRKMERISGLADLL